MMSLARSAPARGIVECVLVSAVFGLLAAFLVRPLGLHPFSYARLDADGQFSIWNVAWVSHAFITAPSSVWDANIFHPLRQTLAFSEANFVAGLLAVPVYAWTRDPFAAHNLVLLFSFVLSGLGAYYLVRHLTADRRAAIVAGICFSFCPYAFAHLSHIQLLFTAGLPFSLLAFHRLSEMPTAGRGVVLGLVLAAQAYACAYYGVFAMLTIALCTLERAALRGLWRSQGFWRAIAVAATVSIVLVVPLVTPYLTLVFSRDVERTLAEADLYSTRGRAYFASAAYAHSWMLPFLSTWREVLFPGFVPVVFGLLGLRRTASPNLVTRATTWLYLLIGALAVWLSFGPRAGLYTLLYAFVPGFTLLRAPSRFGIVVVLALSVLAGLAIAALLRRQRRLPATLLAAAIMLAAVLESLTPTRFGPVVPPSPAYRVLAGRPAGALIELPLYSNRFASLRTKYMLASTIHWKSLVGGYSDHIPEEFLHQEPVLGDFPTMESLSVLDATEVRYAMFHVDEYSGEARDALVARLAAFSHRLIPVAREPGRWLFEILPPD